MKAILLACALVAVPTIAAAEPPAPVHTWKEAARFAGQNYGILPPIEYDHAFRGPIIILRRNEETMKMLCPESALPVTLGCSQRFNNGKVCIVIGGDDALIAKGPWPWSIILRHEVGHCNGWPGDHKGARPLPPDISIETLVKRGEVMRAAREKEPDPTAGIPIEQIRKYWHAWTAAPAQIQHMYKDFNDFVKVSSRQGK